jgi:hypothetical protein
MLTQRMIVNQPKVKHDPASVRPETYAAGLTGCEGSRPPSLSYPSPNNMARERESKRYESTVKDRGVGKVHSEVLKRTCPALHVDWFRSQRRRYDGVEYRHPGVNPDKHGTPSTPPITDHPPTTAASARSSPVKTKLPQLTEVVQSGPVMLDNINARRTRYMDKRRRGRQVGWPLRGHPACLNLARSNHAQNVRPERLSLASQWVTRLTTLLSTPPTSRYALSMPPYADTWNRSRTAGELVRGPHAIQQEPAKKR